ncbi:Uncharacterized protein APZ42_031333, partial [Daphnia magna]
MEPGEGFRLVDDNQKHIVPGLSVPFDGGFLQRSEEVGTSLLLVCGYVVTVSPEDLKGRCVARPIEVRETNEMLRSKKRKKLNQTYRNKVILDEEVEFKNVQYICPHFGTHTSRAKKGLRLNQHVMANDSPVQIRFTYDPDVKKFVITQLELVHQNHPVSEEHPQTYARKKHLAPEAKCHFNFAKKTLAAGAQPTKVRKLLLDKFGSHLISKDIINLKHTLTGKSDEDWKDVVEILSNLKNDENNVIKVLHD